MKRLRRPLWTYRSLWCLLGLHVTSTRRVPKLVPRMVPGVGEVHGTEWRLIAECDRLGCAYSRMLS